MKLKHFIRIGLLTGAGVALVAPFTFLKPVKETKQLTDVVVEKPLPKTVELPLHNIKLPDFANIRDVKTKKKAFFDFIRPAVQKENARLLKLLYVV